MKDFSVILIIILTVVSVAFASDVDNLFFKLSNDFCDKIYSDISNYASPSSLNALAIMNERYLINSYYARMFSDQLTIDLTKKLQIVDREHLKEILAEKKLDLAGLLKSSQGYIIGNLINVKGFLSVSIYKFTYKPITENGFFTESKGYEGSLSGSYNILGLDSVYKLGSNIEVKDKYLTVTKHFARPISYVLASLTSGLICDYYYFKDNNDLQTRLIIDSLVSIFGGWAFGNLFYNVLP